MVTLVQKSVFLIQMTVAADTAAFSATDKHAPRVEAQITYNGGIGDLGINLWVDGSYQNTERTAARSCSLITAHMLLLVLLMVYSQTYRDTDVDSAGVGFGTKLSYQGFAIVASGFYGSGMGVRGQHSLQTGAGWLLVH